MLNKKNVRNHLISLCILSLGFILTRYVFFGIHGMKQWPEILFIVGLIIWGISFVVKAKTVPICLALSHIIGFVAGVIFQTDGVDAGGARTNNLWIIWTLVYICGIGLSIVIEVVATARKK